MAVAAGFSLRFGPAQAKACGYSLYSLRLRFGGFFNLLLPICKGPNS